MTDNEIIKALEHCFKKCDSYCPLHSYKDCKYKLLTGAFYLINRQKVDIERLNEELNIIRAYIHDNGLEWDLLSYSKRNGR